VVMGGERERNRGAVRRESVNSVDEKEVQNFVQKFREVRNMFGDMCMLNTTDL